MLARYRRYWFAAVLVVLWVPLCVQAIEPRATKSFAEGRLLAEPPNWPKSYHDLTPAAAQLRSFLDDHFGLRDDLIKANALVRYSLYSTGSPWVTIGRDGWLFFTGDSDIEQSAGLLIRKSAIERFADFAAALYAEMRRRNVAFIVASPPNSATIQRKYLPAWAAGVPPLTEYDLILKALAQRGVPAVDLRPALTAEQRRRQTYQRTDTHWNDLGALIGYDTVVGALGKSDWAIDPDRVRQGRRRTLGRRLGSYARSRRDAQRDRADHRYVVLFPAAAAGGGHRPFHRVRNRAARPDCCRGRQLIHAWTLAELFQPPRQSVRLDSQQFLPIPSERN